MASTKRGVRLPKLRGKFGLILLITLTALFLFGFYAYNRESTITELKSELQATKNKLDTTEQELQKVKSEDQFAPTIS